MIRIQCSSQRIEQRPCDTLFSQLTTIRLRSNQLQPLTPIRVRPQPSSFLFVSFISVRDVAYWVGIFINDRIDSQISKQNFTKKITRNKKTTQQNKTMCTLCAAFFLLIALLFLLLNLYFDIVYVFLLQPGIASPTQTLLTIHSPPNRPPPPYPTQHFFSSFPILQIARPLSNMWPSTLGHTVST